MYCDLRSAISEGATIIKSPAALNRLPPASEAVFPGLFAWSPVSTSALTAALNLDRGLWATWRSRRLTPSPMPAAWFRRASGSPLIYQVSDVLVWLAARRGEHLDPLTTWRLSLERDLGIETLDPAKIRKVAGLYARAAGPIVGNVKFNSSGFSQYLASLTAA